MIKTKQELLNHFTDINAMYNNPFMYQTLSNMIDELLEQQPCEDCISREAVMHILDEVGEDFDTPREAIIPIDYMADMISELPSVTPSYNSVNTELKSCNDCVSREAVMKCFKKWQPYMATRLWDYEQELSKLPSVTPKADLWSRLYIWLNDMHLGISPDEFTPDDERKIREAQTDIIEGIMGWIEANVFEQKPKEDEE